MLVPSLYYYYYHHHSSSPHGHYTEGKSRILIPLLPVVPGETGQSPDNASQEDDDCGTYD